VLWWLFRDAAGTAAHAVPGRTLPPDEQAMTSLAYLLAQASTCKKLLARAIVCNLEWLW
jgi:hypothetical protein